MSRRLHLIATALGAAVAVFPLTQAAGSPPLPRTPQPPAGHLIAHSNLPPGENGFFSILDQAPYTVDGNPADFGPHVDDQRLNYWTYKSEPDGFATPTGTPEIPRPGVEIYRDKLDIPLIYGKTGYDVWYGEGYAAATDRLFEMDAIRRTSEGTLAELTGASKVPADLQEQIVTYMPRELTRMYEHLGRRGRQAIAGYVAGVQARIDEVHANPTLLPGEYVLLTTEPADWSINDTMATSVFLTRNIASQGGLEMDNVAALRTLERKYGHQAGLRMFQTLFPLDDRKAVTTISNRTFSNLPRGDRSPAARKRNFTAAARYAASLPLSLRNGPGTGASAAPPASPLASVPGLGSQIAAEIRSAVDSINTWSRNLHGGSFGYAISGSRTRNGEAMLSSNPQLTYTYPTELYQVEVHGGGYDARGVGVPGAPTVAIGHTGSVAWALTTGYSKTIDSFIETTRRNPHAGGPPQYRHNGRWHNESCRTLHIKYRLTAPEGIPFGPANQVETTQACRTVHGPIVATTPNGRHARSVDYAMWLQEPETIRGVLAWDRAKTLDQVERGVAKVRWNENIIAADANGHIGYWHPGRYYLRAAGTDQRFPLRGNGSQDMRGYIPFRKMPHVTDPNAGFVANWNTKPAKGWVDGDLSGSATRPAGPANRFGDLQQQLASSHDLTPASLMRIDRVTGEADHRYLGYRPVIRNLSRAHGLKATQRKARTLLMKWDGRAFAPGAPGGSSPLGTPAASVTDGPAATLFAEFTVQAKRLLFGSLPASIRTRLDTVSSEHQYDITPLNNDVLRILVPHFSAIPEMARWARGRSPLTIERQALVGAVRTLQHRYGKSIASWRRPHGISEMDSLAGVVGPSVQMPFEDRGTWVQQIAFTR